MLGALLATFALLAGGFETPAVSGGSARLPAGAQLGPWTVTAGDVDLATAAVWRPAEGRQSLDLRRGTVARTVTTTPLLTYRISYALSGNYLVPPAVKTGELRANGEVVQQMRFDTTGRYRDDMGYARQTAYVLARSSTIRLEFAGATAPGGYGPVIDDVRVDSCLLVLCPKAAAVAV